MTGTAILLVLTSFLLVLGYKLVVLPLLAVSALILLIAAKKIRHQTQKLEALEGMLRSIQKLRPGVRTNTSQQLDAQISALVSEVELLRQHQPQTLFRAHGQLEESFEYFLKTTCTFLGQSSRSKAQFLSVCEPKGTIKLYSGENHPERLRRAIELWTTRYLVLADTSALGLHHLDAGSGTSAELISLGVHTIVCEAVQLRTGDGKQRAGVIALTYDFDHPPLQAELWQIREFSKRLERDLLHIQRCPEGETESGDTSQKISLASPAFTSDHLIHISHDIRSPLNNVKAILQLLQPKLQSEEEKDLLSIALGNCGSAQELVEGILDYSRVHAKTISPRRFALRIEDTIDEVFRNFGVSAKAKGIQLRYQGGCDLQIFADERHVRRILSNLVSNAIKYTNKGVITVEVSQLKAGMVAISVCDTGPGISAPNLSKLFVPFERLGESTKEGLGLGLALSKSLAQANGGSLEVSSQTGIGSRFVLILPKLLHAHNENSSRRLLVVDDDVECAESLAKLLRKFGYQVQCTFGEREALKLLKTDPVDLILSDQGMVGGGARELLVSLRKEGIDTPLFVVSGSVDLNDSRLLKSLGARQIFCKPVQHDVLLRCIDEELSHESKREVA